MNRVIDFIDNISMNYRVIKWGSIYVVAAITYLVLKSRN